MATTSSKSSSSRRRSSSGFTSNASDDQSSTSNVNVCPPPEVTEEQVEDDQDQESSSMMMMMKTKSSSSICFQNYYPREFLLRIPKSDLHIHLDGSIRLSTLVELAKTQNIILPSYNETELRQIVFPQTYSSLQEYLAGFGYILSVLRNKDALERVSYEVGMDAYNVGVRYIEVRFAPQLHAIPGVLSIEEVICAVNRGLGRAMRKADELDRQEGDAVSSSSTTSQVYHREAPPHYYGIIVCAMRYFLPSFSPYYEAFCEVHKGEDLHRIFGLASIALVTAVNTLKSKRECHFEYNHDAAAIAAAASATVAAAVAAADNNCKKTCLDDEKIAKLDYSDTGDIMQTNYKEVAEVSSTLYDDDFTLPIVAIDIAGAESGYPASDHREAFDLAHSSFLYKTVHAGEAYGPESIFSAVTDLHAERIGHGSNIFRWDLIGTGEGRGGRCKSNKEKEEMSDDQKREYVENLTRYLGVSNYCFSMMENRSSFPSR